MPLTLAEVLALIEGHRVVRVTGTDLEWHDEHGWLVTNSSVTLVLDNGVELDTGGEPLNVDLEP